MCCCFKSESWLKTSSRSRRCFCRSPPIFRASPCMLSIVADCLASSFTLASNSADLRSRSCFRAVASASLAASSASVWLRALRTSFSTTARASSSASFWPSASRETLSAFARASSSASFSSCISASFWPSLSCSSNSLARRCAEVGRFAVAAKACAASAAADAACSAAAAAAACRGAEAEAASTAVSRAAQASSNCRCNASLSSCQRWRSDSMSSLRALSSPRSRSKSSLICCITSLFCACDCEPEVAFMLCICSIVPRVFFKSSSKWPFFERASSSSLTILLTLSSSLAFSSARCRSTAHCSPCFPASAFEGETRERSARMMEPRASSSSASPPRGESEASTSSLASLSRIMAMAEA
mmetsp:Transcript_139495/g.446316  ORF Transcript_139495/g.446316 Transcript_139495/m.446316 type:complete len:358 (+) Transcript_139495:1579-2652(+)